MAREKKNKVGAKNCTVDEMCFDVEIHDNPRKTNKEYSKVVTGIINGEEMDLNYCSNIYQLVKNSEIFPSVEQVLFNNAIDFDVKYRHINHVRFYGDYVITDKRYAYCMDNTNDNIMPIIRVQHSYNGLTKYKIVFGYFRMICSNGLTIPVSEMRRFNLEIVGKHTDAIHNSFERLSDMLVYFSKEAAAITKSITTKYEVLGSRWVSDPQKRLETILEASKLTAVDNSRFNTVNDIMARIMTESNKPNFGYNGKVNDWLIYNGINQYLNDDNRNIAVPEVRMEKDSKVLEWMLINE